MAGRPMARTESDMDNAGADRARVDQRPALGGHRAQRGATEPHRHAGPSGNENSATDSGRMALL
jgi:hypothetical protein